MKNILLILSFLLIAYSCTPPTNAVSSSKPKVTVISDYDYNFRWIDNSNVIELIDFSSKNQKISHSDVYTKLGEPVYIEKVYVEDNDGKSQNTILFWYKYKSRLYPVAEQETIKSRERIVNEFGTSQTVESTKTSDYFQIKPTKAEDNSKWEGGDKWLVVIMFDEKYELILSDALGTSSGLYMDFYNLSSAGYLEGNIPETEELLELIEKVVKKAVNNK